MIHVLIVDDSPVVQEFLRSILSSDEEIRVIASAADGEQAVRMVQKLKPDVVTMDIHMPKMDGFMATRKIMETSPVPIVIVSGSYDPGEVHKSFLAMEAGALAILPKPRGYGHPGQEQDAKELIQTVRLMAEVKVVKRWSRYVSAASTPRPHGGSPRKQHPASITLVAIGASTGGPPVLQTILSNLPDDFPPPLAVVQHISPGFLQGLVDWLQQSTNRPIHIGTHGQRLVPGHVYFAPDGHHMGITSDRTVSLTREPPENGLRPSVSHLFRSVLQNFGSRAVGVLLTGMGEDGAKELKSMKDQGAVTLVQDQESSVVHGMPGKAIKLGAALHVLPPEGIARLLRELVQSTSRHGTRDK